MKNWIEIAGGDIKLAEQVREYYELCLAAIPAFPGSMMASDDGYSGGEPTITKEGVKKLGQIYTQERENARFLTIAEQEAMRYQGYGQHLEANPDARSATVLFLLSGIE